MGARHSCARAPRSVCLADSGNGWRIRFADGSEWVREVFYCPFCGVELDAMGKSRFPEMPPNSKRVQCVETGETFPSIAAAARSCGLSRSALYDALHGRRPTAGGRRWEFS